MTVYRKCRPCANRDGCEIKARLSAAIKGFAVGTITHACKSYRPEFKPGDNVWVRAQDIPNSYEAYTSVGIFPAHFVAYSKSLGRAIVYIAPGSKSQCGELEFQPANGKAGFCKVSYAPYHTDHEYFKERGIVERREGTTAIQTCCGLPKGTECKYCGMFGEQAA